ILGAEPLLQLLYGEFYGDASTMLIFLVIAQFAAVLSGPAAVGMAMTGGERALVGISTLAVLFALVAGYFAGMAYGANGVAASSAATLILQSSAMACWFRMHLGIWPIATLSPRRLMVLGRHYLPGTQQRDM
ncbi:MAG: hypothetical protein KJO54_09430, partial [Gammaproteobacteria bacterium]|nr:hypothetical protein [Gammaproteobacteria bacterium]